MARGGPAGPGAPPPWQTKPCRLRSNCRRPGTEGVSLLLYNGRRGLTVSDAGAAELGRFNEEAMLRRTKTIVLKEDNDAAAEATSASATAGGAAPEGVAPGAQVGAMRAEIEGAFTRGTDAGPVVRGPDRRKGERRGMDALRDEALRNVISMVEDKNFGGLRDNAQWRRRLPLSRLVLLAVAIAAGGVAMYLATSQNSRPAPEAVAEPAPQVVQEPRTRILVARVPIGVGQRLSPDVVEWQDWPEGAVRADYISIAAAPDAIGDMAGTVVRYDIFPGEPIREQKLATAGDGLLSAVLGSGKRGVSATVTAASAAGGFILPNDHVDVVVTRDSAAGQFSETILSNVRVLAIDARLGEAPGREDAAAGPSVFEGKAIATLELDPAGAEVLIGAANGGTLSLVLRSLLDFAEDGGDSRHAVNTAIRLTSPFWRN